MRTRQVPGVPAPAPHELRRERLLEVLHRQRSRPLILLVAPAGFGKSTLAATYARDSGAAVAWLTLQSADRDSRRLFARLADVLEAAFDDEYPLRELRSGLDTGSEGVGLARLLLADLEQAPASFILILDDFHLVEDADEVLSSTDALVRGLPDQGQLAITAREPPALSMTRLVAADAVFALGTEDLRFTPEETRALRKAVGGDPSRDEQAEGWVAGILLGGAPRQLGVGGGSLLGTYVDGEVLSRLRRTEQRWLESLSVLDTITPAAAERLLGPGPWLARLLALTERCPFLVAGQDSYFRLHALVREALVNRLRRAGSARAARAWSLARDLAVEAFDTVAAVRACHELGDMDAAIQLVRRASGEAMHKGRWSTVLSRVQLLPESVRRSQPDLSLMEARALLNSGQITLAKEAAEAVLHQGGRSEDVAVQVSALIELATVDHVAGDITAAEDWLSAADHLLRHSRLPTETRRWLEGRTLGVRGICAAVRGQTAEAHEAFSTAERLLRHSLTYAHTHTQTRELALVQQNMGAFCIRIGDYASAQAALTEAAAHWRVMGDRNGLATTQNLVGDLHLRLGELEAAGAALSDALEAARAVGALRMEAYAIVSLGQWHRASGRLPDAVAAFDEGLRLAEEIIERDLIVTALVSGAEVALLQGDTAKARALLPRAQAEAQLLGSNAALATVERALGRLHLAEGAGDQAVKFLESALRRAGESWGADERAQTLYWLGTAYLHLRRAQQACGLLAEAIAAAERTDVAPLLAGPAAEDPRLLRAGLETGLNPVVLGEVDRLAATRQPWSGVRQPRLTLVADARLPRIEVQLFGSFVVHRDGTLLESARKRDRTRELLALLVLNPKGLPDEVIAELMWPGMETQSALHNLQTATWALRHDLGGKAAVRFSAGAYQLNPQLELIADVHLFEAALARARGATGDDLIQALSKAVELYRDPLLADVAWRWVDPVRHDYRSRFVGAALQLADLLARTDTDRSDWLGEIVIAVAPDTDIAYERLIQNATLRRDSESARRLIKRYKQAAAQFSFNTNPTLTRVGLAGRPWPALIERN